MKEQSEQNVKVLRHNKNFSPAPDITESFPFPWLGVYSDHYIHIYVESILEKKKLEEFLKAFCFALRSFKTQIYCVSSENKILFVCF